ncbi:hypothetical protein [Aliivibrio fischeri]|uniref:hypothetical protein n=1 Tax=Aliivibrio fischeri TaxID=668 RepID=UPI0012DA1A42|nr:hypothetical protein [Aliivibrio fischeri]MUL11524.1 hypothetical protein [Aliivibrio fischeri]MUL15431.1 hypothetical protein [Aliivibrio fischeri]
MNNSKSNTKTEVPAYKIKEAFILSLILMTLFVTLFVKGLLSEGWFFLSILLTSFVGIIIYFSGRVVHVKMQNLELTLHEIQETETSIKNLASLIVNVVESSRDNILEFRTNKKSDFDKDLEKLRELSK